MRAQWALLTEPQKEGVSAAVTREGGRPGEKPYVEEWGGTQSLQASFKRQGWAERSIQLVPKLTSQVPHSTSSGTERGEGQRGGQECAQ